MTECEHRWGNGGMVGNNVVCVRCGASGTVTVEATPPNHLERAREEHHAALILTRGSALHIAHLEGAIGHIICYLEGKD